MAHTAFNGSHCTQWLALHSCWVHTVGRRHSVAGLRHQPCLCDPQSRQAEEQLGPWLFHAHAVNAGEQEHMHKSMCSLTNCILLIFAQTSSPGLLVLPYLSRHQVLRRPVQLSLIQVHSWCSTPFLTHLYTTPKEPFAISSLMSRSSCRRDNKVEL